MHIEIRFKKDELHSPWSTWVRPNPVNRGRIYIENGCDVIIYELRMVL
jgi:hypothetical protein